MFSSNAVSNYSKLASLPALTDDCSKKVTVLNHTVQVPMDATSAKVSTIPHAHEPMQESPKQEQLKRTIADVGESMEESPKQNQLKRTIADIGEPMEEPLNQLQVKRARHCEVTTMAGQNTAEFKKDDLLLVYPSSPDREYGTNIFINPRRLLDELNYELYSFDDYKLSHPDQQIMKKSILQKLPPDFKEFLGRDWSAQENWLLTPEEYQPLARFHWAVVGHEKYELSKRFCNEKRDIELVKLFEAVSLPLRNGWSEEELDFLEGWLGSSLWMHYHYEWDNFSEYIDFCHKGILDAGCVSLCDECAITRVIENREAYERIERLEQQLRSSGKNP